MVARSRDEIEGVAADADADDADTEEEEEEEETVFGRVFFAMMTI